MKVFYIAVRCGSCCSFLPGIEGMLSPPVCGGFFSTNTTSPIFQSGGTCQLDIMLLNMSKIIVLACSPVFLSISFVIPSCPSALSAWSDFIVSSSSLRDIVVSVGFWKFLIRLSQFYFRNFIILDIFLRVRCVKFYFQSSDSFLSGSSQYVHP